MIRFSLILYLLVIVCGQHWASQAAENPSPDYAALADPARLQAIKDDCRQQNASLLSSPVTTDMVQGQNALAECWISAAVAEFAENIATANYTADMFEAELRSRAASYSQFLDGILDRPLRVNWGTSGGLREGDYYLELVERSLDEIWRFYRLMKS